MVGDGVLRVTGMGPNRGASMNEHMMAALESVQREAEDRMKITDPVISAFKGLKKYIQDFEDGLDADHEVGARLVSFGNEVRFHVEKVGYMEPTLVTFIGVSDAGDRVQLVQHVSQISVLLIALKRREEKPYRVGFYQD